MRRIALIQKDSLFRPVPPERGGASGEVWYSPSGRTLSFRLRASGLVPHRRYELDLTVDSVTYTLASRPASADGDIALDTTITEFAEGACVGANYDRPRPLTGPHRIKFAVKNDGSPPSGASGVGDGGDTLSAAGVTLPCAGNGDGDYSYVLYEGQVAEFEGRGGR